MHAKKEEEGQMFKEAINLNGISLRSQVEVE